MLSDQQVSDKVEWERDTGKKIEREVGELLERIREGNMKRNKDRLKTEWKMNLGK